MNRITTLTIAITIAAFAGSAAAGPQTQDSPQPHKMAGMSSKAATSTKKEPAASKTPAASAKKKLVTAAKNRMNMPKQPAKKASGKMNDMDMNAKGDGMPMRKELNMDKPMMNKDMDMMDKEMNMKKMEKKKPVKKAPAKPKDTKMKDMDDMDMM